MRYVDALVKDLNKLEADMDAINKALKKNAADKAALAAKAKLAPFLTADALKKRYDLATKLDQQDMLKRVKECGF
jgi:predicted nuclease with TOPRIM domain